MSLVTVLTLVITASVLADAGSEFLLGQVHTSTAYVVPLAAIESQMVALIEEYIREEEQRIYALRRYASDWTIRVGDAASYAQSPLGSYHLLQRIVHEFPKVEKLIADYGGHQLLKSLRSVRDSGGQMPEEGDIKGVAWAIAHLQYIYDLPLQDITNGIIKNAPKAKPLSGDDCFRIGEESYTNLAFNLSEMWTLEAVELWGRVKPVSKPNLDKIERARDLIAKRRIMQELLTTMAKKANTQVVNHFSGLGLPKSFAREMYRDPTQQKNVDTAEEVYRRLCQGEKMEVFPRVKELSCHYVFGGPQQPALWPFKVERVYAKPEISIFYDVLTEEEMLELQALAFPKMVNGKVKPYATISTMDVSIARVGKSAWLYRSNHTLVDKLLKRVGLMAGLNTRYADNIHVFNYGVGGHYEMHIDYFDFANRDQTKDSYFYKGDQIATFLFYLNDVDCGGSTVFPYINVEVRPKRGSVLFWYNLQRSGKGNIRTMHASCPVLLGQKWIATIWLNEIGQEFIRPCLLDPTE